MTHDGFTKLLRKAALRDKACAGSGETFLFAEPLGPASGDEGGA